VIDRPLFSLNNPNIVLSTLQRDKSGALLIRLKSISEVNERAGIESIHIPLKNLVVCSGDKETPIGDVNGFTLSPYEIVTLKLK
jgi:alpha-mannosidase